MHTLPTIESQVATTSIIPATAAEPSTFFGNFAAPLPVIPGQFAPETMGDMPPILVADDDPDDRFLITRLITKTGVMNGVRDFDDGSEVVNYLGAIAAAGAAARHHIPRLLFLDLRMNGLGGFGFLEWVRAQQTKLPLTIVVLSNSVESADVQRARELGAHRYLVKYPSVQTFSSIVRSVYPFHLAAL
jgi:CheY-like chemotaxis protein